MSEYTTTFYEIGLGISNTPWKESTENIVENVRKFIFTFNFPFYDDNKLKDFQEKFIKHFFFREIGFETVNLFKFRLNETLNLIMPYYNKLYLANEEKLEIFTTDKFQEQVNSESNSESNVKGNSNTEYNEESITRFSSTPQGGLSDVKNDKYLTSLTVDNNSGETESTTSSTSNGNSNVITTRTNEGRGGVSEATLLQQYYDVQRNIDEEVFDSLEELFMLIF